MSRRMLNRLELINDTSQKIMDGDLARRVPSRGSGDEFDQLVSMSSASRGVKVFYASRFGDKHPLATRKYKCGDVNTTMIRTKNGRTITLGHGTQLPRPYTRINMVQGTLGIVQGYPDRIALESHSRGHTWEPIDKYLSLIHI